MLLGWKGSQAKKVGKDKDGVVWYDIWLYKQEDKNQTQIKHLENIIYSYLAALNYERMSVC